MKSSIRALSTPRSPDLRERPAGDPPGVPLLLMGIVLLLGGVLFLLLTRAHALPHLVGVAVAALGVLTLSGLTSVLPGQPRVVQLFGAYRGTVRHSGLRWTNPFARRRAISTRLRNHETATLKVNDQSGNPIEIAAVVVWQVEDTARALYDVEEVAAFVSTQAETAVRHIAQAYPYDAHEPGRPSLRDSANAVPQELSAELARRMTSAGVHIVESRLSRLSYAPEIAHAMLQRQQADAVVAARERIVAGAVGMVEMALDRLAEDEVVELDDERRAAMVSNLLVVLCADRTQPIVNAGSLYQ